MSCIHILSQGSQIELSRDVTFVEDTAFKKSKKDKEDEEHETPKDAESPKLVRNKEEVQIPRDHDITEP